MFNKKGGVNLKLRLFAFFIICIVYSTAFAGDTANLPVNSRIFYSEEDCFEVMKLHYNWNIEFAAHLRDMEKNGKFIKNSQKLPINILETKSYKEFDYYKISIYNNTTKQYDIFWTDAAKLD